MARELTNRVTDNDSKGNLQTGESCEGLPRIIDLLQVECNIDVQGVTEYGHDPWPCCWSHDAQVLAFFQYVRCL